MRLVRHLNRPEYIEDTKRIQLILFAHGCEASLVECEKVWQDHSESFSAGWLILPEEDDALWGELQPYIVDD